MRGRAWVVFAGIVAGGCATGSDMSSNGDLSGEVEAGDDSALPAHDASTGHDASASVEAGGGQEAAGDGAGDATADDAAFADGNPAEDADASLDATSPAPDASDASDARVGGPNLGPLGIGYTWQSMTSATANTGRLPSPPVNDDSLSTQANIDSSTGDDTNAWEAAGVVFASARSVSSVTFVQGTTGTATAGDGWFEAGFALQLSTDGTTWSNASWSASPAYAYSSAVSGKTYVFSGAAVSGIVGVRVVGQVNTIGKSWWEAVKEVMVFAP